MRAPPLRRTVVEFAQSHLTFHSLFWVNILTTLPAVIAGASLRDRHATLACREC